MTVTTIMGLSAAAVVLWGVLLYFRNNWLFNKILPLAGTPEFAPFREGAYEWIFWRWWRWDLDAAVAAWRTAEEECDAEA